MGIGRATEWHVGKVDRTKSDWDVMEHVLGGVRATDGDHYVPNTHVLDLGMRPSFGGTIRSAVQLSVLRDDEDERKHSR